MDEKMLLQAISQMMDEKLKPVHSEMGIMSNKLESITQRLDRLEEKVDELAENEELTREGVNTLLDWADRAASAIKVPLIK